MKTLSDLSLRKRSGRSAFTLVELLVSTGVLSILMLITMSALETMQRSWRDTKGKVNQFRGARIAFDTITQNLSQATLNTYWDYYYKGTSSNIPPADNAAPPFGYVRQSELDFRVEQASTLAATAGSHAEYPGHGLFFQAPLGLSQGYRELSSLLNARGYYIRFTSNERERPEFLPENIVPVKYRYQLMEYRPPAERVVVEGSSLQGNTVYTNANWHLQNLAAASRPIADNILLLIISPQVPPETVENTPKDPFWIAPQYRYRSRDAFNKDPAIDGPKTQGTEIDQGTQHLLPPLVRVTLIAGEEGSVNRWIAAHGNEPVDICAEAKADFEEVAKYERDLEAMKTYLTEERINFRVFSATVAMRNAAWDSKTFDYGN